MKHTRLSHISVILLLGDSLVLLGVTLWGFSIHETLGTGGVRIWATLVPLWLAWLLAAFPSGGFDPLNAVELRQLWRPFWAMCLAVPMAMWLRAAWLGIPVQPVFVFVMVGLNSLAIVIWRGLFALLSGQKGRLHG